MSTSDARAQRSREDFNSVLKVSKSAIRVIFTGTIIELFAARESILLINDSIL